MYSTTHHQVVGLCIDTQASSDQLCLYWTVVYLSNHYLFSHIACMSDTMADGATRPSSVTVTTVSTSQLTGRQKILSGNLPTAWLHLITNISVSELSKRYHCCQTSTWNLHVMTMTKW